jgi:hypothetical protein
LFYVTHKTKMVTSIKVINAIALYRKAAAEAAYKV